ncbi:DsrE family protein [Acidiferrobacter sp.]|jgi:intracellular sulfur oxidation DsrE/DsrF family protein|uniref:DsrE family protein n=1 Tax=Acidiferrobacter sp. TaxID=1872107 RepID=UPI0026164AF7|nr:DsrE family protein [Acidiferrobacter sp.]
MTFKSVHNRFAAAFAMMALLMFAAPSYAGMQSHAFATHHVVFQISNGSALEQRLVLANVANVLKYYGPTKVQIEIVAFGPGLRLLLKHNVHSKMIQSLHAEGVEIAACHNTMMKMHLTKADLNPVAHVVPGGVIEIMRRESEGWNYIRP